MNIVLFAIMTFCASVASILLKQVSQNKMLQCFSKPKFWIAGFLYVLSAGINIILLTRLPYSVVVPLGSVTYVWTLFLSGRVLKEKVTVKKVLGVVLVLAGVLLVASQK